MNSRDYKPKGLSLPAGMAGAVFVASIMLNILLWIIVLVTFPKDSPAAVLHYTAGIGVDFIGDGWQIITLPGIGTLLLVVNTILARLIQEAGPQGAGKLAFWLLWGSVPLFQCILLGIYGIVLTLNT